MFYAMKHTLDDNKNKNQTNKKEKKQQQTTKTQKNTKNKNLPSYFQINICPTF